MVFLRYIIEAGAFYLIYTLSNILPIRVCYKLSYVFGSILYILLSRRRSLGRQKFNPIVGKENADKIIKNVMINFCKNLSEFCRMHRFNKTTIKKYIDIEGLEHINSGLSEGRGVLLVSFHLGNIELAGAALSMLGYPFWVVVWRNPNKLISNRLLKQRLSVGVKPIVFGGSGWLRKVQDVLKQNGIVALLCDLDGGDKGVKFNFAGRMRSFSRVIMSLAMASSAVIIPGFNIRCSNDKLKAVILPQYKPTILNNKNEYIYHNTKNLIMLFEPYIRRYPDQWLWIPLEERKTGLIFGKHE